MAFSNSSRKHFEKPSFFFVFSLPFNNDTTIKLPYSHENSSAYSKLTRFLDALIFEKNQEMLIFDNCLFKKNVKDVKKLEVRSNKKEFCGVQTK